MSDDSSTRGFHVHAFRASDEAMIENIWESFGNSLLDIGSRHVDLWNQSVDRGAELTDLPQVADFISEFQDRALSITCLSRLSHGRKKEKTLYFNK